MPTSSSLSLAAPLRIAGWGLVTPLGRSAWETFAALLAGRTIADRAAALEEAVDPIAMVRALGCVAHVQHAAADPSVELAETAAREALHMAGVAADEPIDVVLGVSKGAMVAMTQAACEPRLRSRLASVVTLGPGEYLAHELRRRLAIDSITTVVAACASSLTALHMARLRLLRGDDLGNAHHTRRLVAPASSRPRRILVLTSEAALLPAFIHSYARLGVLPPLSPSQYRGLPLDRRRHGFMLAEQAAAVVLEHDDSATAASHAGSESAKTRGSVPREPGMARTCHLHTTAIAAEGHDLIRAAPGMPALANVARQVIADHAITMVHPHATGTPEHDEAELAVYESVLAARPGGALAAAPSSPDLYAAKGAIGHGLGAAGLVSLVIACLCHRTGRRPPMPWLQQPIATSLPLIAQPTTPRVSGGSRRYHAVFAAGFGGHVAGALIGDA